MTASAGRSTGPHAKALPPRWRALGIPILLILVTTAVAVALLVAWRHELPDPMATHFDGAGKPDGFSNWRSNLLFTIGLGMVVPLVMLLGIALPGKRKTDRLGAVIGTSMSGFILAMSTLAVADQRGLADPHQARMGGIPLLVGVLLAAALAGVAFAVTPPAPATTVDPVTLPTMELGPGERVSWTSHEWSPVVIAIGVVMALGGLGYGLIAQDLVPALLLPVIGLLTASLGHARATVDTRGFTWRLGVVHRRIPLARITSARAVEVEPTRYGGWGYRLSGEGHAIVMRRGPGLRLTRQNQPDLTITVPDAQTGAALLNSLIGIPTRV